MSEHGPKVTKLINRYMAQLAVQNCGELDTATKFFIDAGYRKQIMNRAETEVMNWISVVKTAPDNPYSDDEQIADALLSEVEKRLSIIKENKS